MAITVLRPLPSEDEQVEAHTERIWATLPKPLVKEIDDYFHQNRLRSRSEAVRLLIEYGLHYARTKEKGMS